MLRVEEAQERVLAALEPLGDEKVMLAEAAGRVLAEDVVAPRALPPWDNSAMDGYAVRAADCAQPGTELGVGETIGAGHLASRPLARGEAMRIMTGAPLPAGADAIVKREDTEETAPGRVRMREAVQAGDHVRHAGDDVRAGEVALGAGTALGAGEIGLLAALGRATLSVHRRPTVSIVSTGDELCDLDQAPGPGQIVNSNAWALATMVRAAGALPVIHPITRDNPEALRTRFRLALAADVLVSIGGVSVGEFDYVKDALAAVGLTLDFWKVAMQPGKPLAFALSSHGPAFGLPGNPASSMVSFELFVRPALCKLGGHRTGMFRPRVTVVFGERARKSAGRRMYLRCQLRREGETLFARPLAHQGSGMLRSMIGVSALVELAEEMTEVEPGARLPALLLEPI
ncbi:MAG TPA: gephyrin-like molybdotransferase Glp [Polyangia bacterium]|nr:gephyrin-like molybdotransferase Glp [Polyangia bacterium]